MVGGRKVDHSRKSNSEVAVLGQGVHISECTEDTQIYNIK